MTNKILIVSRSFHPQNSPRSFRTTELAKEFARQGHEVTVLIPNLTEEQQEYAGQNGFNLKNLGNTTWRVSDFGNSKVGYLLTRAAVRFLQLGFEYPGIELLFMVNRALQNESGYDLLISIAVPYPIHWGVAKARTHKHRIAKVWVADCGDPYMGCDTDTFKKPFYFKYLEKWFMNKADAISIPVATALDSYYKEFHKKIKIIPQGFKIDNIINDNNKTKTNSMPVFGYAGGFIPNIRDPRPFLEYLSQLEEQFKFIIHTNNDAIIKPYKQLLGDKLEIHEFIPRTELLKKFSSFDFLVNFDNNTQSAIPSKLIDYAIMGLPVLNITNQFEPKVIREFLSGNFKNAMTLPDIEAYRIENVCNQFLSLT
ncbi:glycosyltransferase [Macellibacteroides fermentans]|uniref:glycosyltransferase n=1 Tax=Macellibacteroides fermentans TaxID=879969 RepID=UPI00406CC6DA